MKKNSALQQIHYLPKQNIRKHLLWLLLIRSLLLTDPVYISNLGFVSIRIDRKQLRTIRTKNVSSRTLTE